MRLIPCHEPRKGPFTVTASMKYCEQVGKKRQPLKGPQRKWSGGEITTW
jgi:hypothetical protein